MKNLFYLFLLKTKATEQNILLPSSDQSHVNDKNEKILKYTRKIQILFNLLSVVFVIILIISSYYNTSNPVKPQFKKTTYNFENITNTFNENLTIEEDVLNTSFAKYNNMFEPVVDFTKYEKFNIFIMPEINNPI